MILTLDLELQKYGEQLLKNKRGGIVVIEPQTGEVLSLVSAPSYDPNLLVKVPFKNNKFEVDIRSENYNNVSIMSIGKFTKMKCDIYIDKIWLFNDRFYCKWKVRRIYIL